jgi:ParB family transcriptional regulator, chromosome partitioning protein
MSAKQRVSKERQELEEQSRRALAGLGITNETAIHGVLAETLGVPVEAAPSTLSLKASPPSDERAAPSEPPPPVTLSTPKPALTPVVASPPPIPSHSPDTTPSPESEGERVHNLPLDVLDPSPDQPRLQAEPDPELLENIRLFGVRTPIHVRPVGNGRYHIVAGERRWRACQILGKATIPALIRRDNTEVAAAEALIDNLLRKELTGYEEAKGYKRLIEEHRYLKSELAQRLGCDKTRITRALQVLDLPDHIIELTLGPGSPLTLTHVQELLPLRSNLVRLQKVARQAIDGGWTARRIREEVTRVPRTNQGAQSVRFDARGTDGPFRLVIRFHPNRAYDIRLIEEGLRKAQEHLDSFQRSAPS